MGDAGGGVARGEKGAWARGEWRAVVGRASACGGETRRGGRRAVGRICVASWGRVGGEWLTGAGEAATTGGDAALGAGDWSGGAWGTVCPSGQYSPHP